MVEEMVVNWIVVKKLDKVEEKEKDYDFENISDVVVSGELLRDFVKKFGYYEDMIVMGFSKFGFLVDMNLLLLELVKV